MTPKIGSELISV